MIEEKALSDACDDFYERFPSFDGCISFLNVYDIPQGVYKPFCCYAITSHGSFVVTHFLVTLVSRDETKFSYTIYDQSLGKEGILRYV